MGENGRFKILGRKKNIIKRGGESYYPPSCEEFTLHNPKVARVVVVGVPHQRLFEEVCVCVVFKEGEDKETAVTSLKQWFDTNSSVNADGLPWSPGYILAMDDFPVTKTGKVHRVKIRELAIEELGIKT